MSDAKPPIIFGEYGTLVGFLEGYPLVVDSRSRTTEAWFNLLGNETHYDSHGNPVQGTATAFARARREGQKGNWYCVHCYEYAPAGKPCDRCGRGMDDK